MTGKKDSEHSKILEERKEQLEQKTCIGKLLEGSSESLHDNKTSRKRPYHPDIVIPSSFIGTVALEYRLGLKDMATEKFNEYGSACSEAACYLQEVLGSF